MLIVLMQLVSEQRCYLFGCFVQNSWEVFDSAFMILRPSGSLSSPAPCSRSVVFSVPIVYSNKETLQCCSGVLSVPNYLIALIFFSNHSKFTLDCFIIIIFIKNNWFLFGFRVINSVRVNFEHPPICHPWLGVKLGLLRCRTMFKEMIKPGQVCS